MNAITTLLLVLVSVIWAQNIGSRNLLTSLVGTGAVCLDGTPAAYYYSPGSGDGVSKWFLHHQGGGYCSSLQDCYGRSQGDLGSSKGYPPTINLESNGGYFSNNQKVNPLMYNWNMVFFAYCDGGFYSGNNETVTDFQGHKLYFRGFRNVQAYFKDLSDRYGLMKGTDFVIGGCSAGGIATYYNVDWWRENLPKTSTVKGLPDSGFVLDYSAVGGGRVFDVSMNWIFNQMNTTSGLNQACIAAHTKTNDPEKCTFAEYTAPYITTPIFPLQSQYDAWQVENILKTTDPNIINQFGQILESRFKAAVMKNDKNGCFFDSCYHHCGYWDSIRIGNTLSGDAFKAWYEGQNNGTNFQDKVYPCPSCCQA